MQKAQFAGYDLLIIYCKSRQKVLTRDYYLVTRPGPFQAQSGFQRVFHPPSNGLLRCKHERRRAEHYDLPGGYAEFVVLLSFV
jgi:hypothetical protein